STSMYNHITNNWNREHVISVDPYHPNIYNHLMEYFEQWLKNHPYTKVVRLTTLAYHFPIDSLPGGGTKFRDWLGYTDAISPGALDDFEKEKGYKLRSEDIVDGGYYNATYRVPSEKYLEWMDFIHKFVVRFGKDLTDRIHKAGKKAALFWGDHWIGTEPYSSHFQKMNIDINIGACRDGVGLRRIADAPGNQEKEIRLYPYFFPDVFKPGGDPTGESMDNWIKIRRALLRKKVDRIGYGGYLSLAVKFNDFLEHVEELCNQFREIKNNSEPEESYKAPVRVAVLNAWGKSRSWINDLGVDYKLNSNKNPSNFLECLSGLPFNVEFINFDDIEKKGVLDNIDIIINNGEAGSAWSGGFHWKNEKIRSIIKEWVYCGGGFIGIGDPSAYDTDISYFQLSDVLGVDKEIGKSIACSAYEFKLKSDHFILEDSNDKIKLTAEKSYVYKSSRKTDVLLSGEGIHILMAANKFGKGRSVYMASLPYSLQNSRILLRSIFWASNKENEMKKWFSANINTDCAYYRSKKLLAVINNVNDEQNTTIIDDKNNEIKVFLKPYETKWLDL
ncbi:MAG: 1,3-beta-galactosyl-N-acetylhexosamine phosphorylase, partial [Kiritimatiellia bacterium]|nr:1,3-beta-galactosyl-N-acetylhexosamine phosphorylase [Kiritimatiellia bacterium]